MRAGTALSAALPMPARASPAPAGTRRPVRPGPRPSPARLRRRRADLLERVGGPVPGRRHPGDQVAGQARHRRRGHLAEVPKRLHQALLGGSYAVLLACAGRGCDVFTEGEFRSRFPDLAQPGFSAKNFFPDASADKVRLGLFVVDHDKLSSRMAGKVRRRVGGHARDRPPRPPAARPGRATRRPRGDGHRGQAAEPPGRVRPEAAPDVAVTVEAHPELEDFFLVNRR